MGKHESAQLVVVGGGGAGLMAAWWSARVGAQTVVLEGSRDCGRKILISGGGRCNLLPTEAEVDDFYTSGSRNVLKRLFRTWSLEEVRRFFEEEFGIPLVEEEETGKLFPEWQRAKPVRDRMVEKVREAGAEIRAGWRVAGIARAEEGGFLLESPAGESLHARRLIVATGGCSVPETGSDGAGYELMLALGHSVLATYPALVPLTSRDPGFREMAGMSLPVRWRARLDGKLVEERSRELLFTHKGFSGPAILDASHWSVRDGADLEVAWGDGTGEEWEEHWKSRGRRECAKAISDFLPKRLAADLCRRAGLRPDTRIGNLNRPDRERLKAVLCNFTLPVSGHEGFRVAEVTGGGIPLDEVNPSTLASRKQEGLFLCGEILDVIGRIGGYNFLWAWITGRLAGESAAQT